MIEISIHVYFGYFLAIILFYTRKRSQIFIIIAAMFLPQALNNIKNIESSIDRQRVLAETLKNPEKLAKTLLRVEFLTACRKYKVVPKFIEDALKPVTKIFPNNERIRNRSESFSSTLLNEAISEAFRHKAFLERRRVTLKNECSSFLSRDTLAEIAFNCNRIFDNTIRENRPRLVDKFNRRRLSTRDRTEMLDGGAVTTQTAANSDCSRNNNRVNNLSSLPLDATKLDILSKGPNFAVTQTISKRVILEVEKSVERLAYAKRWKDDITKRRQNAATAINQAMGGGEQQEDRATGSEVGHQTRAPLGSGGNTGDRQESNDGQREEEERRQRDEGATRSDGDLQADGDERHSSRGRVPNLNFRFPDTCKRFPPPSNVDVERSLHKLKQDVVRVYKNHKTAQSNATQEQIDLVTELARNQDIVVKQSDKCKGLVVLDKEDYQRKVENILGDSEKYEKLAKNPVPQVEAKTKQVFKQVSRGKLPDKTVEELTPMHSRTPLFYGLPKDHKPAVPLRPVVSGSGGPTEKTACLLETILKQLLSFVPTHLWDTKDFLTRVLDHCNSQPLSEADIFFSIDVVNLYGSIPVDEAIEAAKQKLDEHGQDIQTFGLSHNDICALLDQCLRNNVFSFGDEYYRQKQGIAMGNPCAPPLAILFLDRFEQQALANAPHKPSLTRARVWSDI